MPVATVGDAGLDPGARVFFFLYFSPHIMRIIHTVHLILTPTLFSSGSPLEWRSPPPKPTCLLLCCVADVKEESPVPPLLHMHLFTNQYMMLQRVYTSKHVTSHVDIITITSVFNSGKCVREILVFLTCWKNAKYPTML